MSLPPASAPAERVSPLLHHVHDDGVVSVLLPSDHSLSRWDGALTAMVEVVDIAPVPLRESVRGLLWITGQLSVLPLSEARGVALSIAALRPDPRLLDLGLSHTEVVHTLRRHLPEQLRGGHLRPLGLDRYGLRLRVEGIDGDHDVRLAFSRPIGTLRELSEELRRMVGCPFMALQHGA